MKIITKVIFFYYLASAGAKADEIYKVAKIYINKIISSKCEFCGNDKNMIYLDKIGKIVAQDFISNFDKSLNDNLQFVDKYKFPNPSYFYNNKTAIEFKKTLYEICQFYFGKREHYYDEKNKDLVVDSQYIQIRRIFDEQILDYLDNTNKKIIKNGVRNLEIAWFRLLKNYGVKKALVFDYDINFLFKIETALEVLADKIIVSTLTNEDAVLILKVISEIPCISKDYCNKLMEAHANYLKDTGKKSSVDFRVKNFSEYYKSKEEYYYKSYKRDVKNINLKLKNIILQRPQLFDKHYFALAKWVFQKIKNITTKLELSENDKVNKVEILRINKKHGNIFKAYYKKNKLVGTNKKSEINNRLTKEEEKMVLGLIKVILNKEEIKISKCYDQAIFDLKSDVLFFNVLFTEIAYHLKSYYSLGKTGSHLNTGKEVLHSISKLLNSHK